MPTRKGSVKLFRFLGVDVYLHWAWFVAFLYFTSRPHAYSNYGWSALEILSLFLIVLTHEFGHALACRSVGGTANLIVLWPLGGVAYVSPPQRPGAQLWSIAAGPLVNVALAPALIGLVVVGKKLGWNGDFPDAYLLLRNVAIINTVLLVFNLMPVYPLDGGQILRSLLWFPFGRANSLMAASVIGIIGVVGFILFAIYAGSVWLGIMAAFILLNCWGGLMRAAARPALALRPVQNPLRHLRHRCRLPALRRAIRFDAVPRLRPALSDEPMACPCGRRSAEFGIIRRACVPPRPGLLFAP